MQTADGERDTVIDAVSLHASPNDAGHWERQRLTPEDVKLFLPELVETHRHWVRKGEVASYIPELQKMDGSLLGVSLAAPSGELIEAGDTHTPLTLQSISKVPALLLALRDRGPQQVFERVGVEPSGDAFNSIMKLELVEPKKPLNPMINAGAIVVTSLIRGNSAVERFQRLLSFVRRICRNPAITVDEAVYESESATGDRNRALAFYIKGVGGLQTGEDVETIVRAYFRQCSIAVQPRDLAAMGQFLAGDGRVAGEGDPVVSPEVLRIVRAILVTCGMYNGSGEFAVRVGLPAKSGVSGGIMAVLPDGWGAGVIGPALDERGNSVAGVRLLETLSHHYALSLFA